MFQTNPISFAGLRGTSFDNPGEATSALAQMASQFSSAVLVDIVETGNYLTWLVTGTNSNTLPQKPASWSDTDWQIMLDRFGNWFCYSVAFAQTNQIPLYFLQQEAQRLAEAKKLGMAVKVYDEVLQVFVK